MLHISALLFSFLLSRYCPWEHKHGVRRGERSGVGDVLRRGAVAHGSLPEEQREQTHLCWGEMSSSLTFQTGNVLTFPLRSSNCGRLLGCESVLTNSDAWKRSGVLTQPVLLLSDYSASSGRMFWRCQRNKGKSDHLTEAFSADKLHRRVGVFSACSQREHTPSSSTYCSSEQSFKTWFESFYYCHYVRLLWALFLRLSLTHPAKSDPSSAYLLWLHNAKRWRNNSLIVSLFPSWDCSSLRSKRLFSLLWVKWGGKYWKQFST